MTKKCYTTVDLLKFIFCLFVIALHANLFETILGETGFYITRFISGLAVPYFFVASGYFLGGKYKSTDKANHKHILSSYLKRLLYPFVVFSIMNITQALSTELISGIGKWSALKRVIQHIVFYPYGALWFVQALIVAAILMYPIMKFKNGVNICLIAGVVLYAFALICNNYYFVVENTPLANIVDLYLKYCITARNGLFVGVVFLALGMKCYEIKNSQKQLRHSVIYFLTVLTFALYIIEVVLLHISDAKYVDNRAYYIMFLFLIPLLFLSSVLFNLKIPYSVSIISRNLSTGMYYLHCPVLWYFELYSKNVILNYCAVTLISFVICMISYKVEFKHKYYLLR